jgi:hypothetical protein
MSARQKGQTLDALKAKAQKDIGTTKRALDKLKIIAPERSHLKKMAEDCLSMAKAYYNDAVHFFEKGDYINAFACVNYAHGWLDAGARLGIFEVGGDDKLFTLAE